MRCCGPPSIFKILFLAFILGPLLLPIIKLGFFVLSLFLFTLNTVAPFALIAMICSMSDCASPCDIARRMKKWHRSRPETWTVREHMAKSTESEASKKDEDEVSTESTDINESPIRYVVSAPGVNPADLKVTTLDNTISIKGETKRGDCVFAVDKQIIPPRLADIDTAECTHVDGIVTITMRPKVSKRIPVQVAREVAEGVGEHVFNATEIPTTRAPRAAAASEDEWVAED